MCPDARRALYIILPYGKMQEATMEHDGFSFANTDGDMSTRLEARLSIRCDLNER